ncbi:MAG: DUF2330 domain-containing protein, partial [Okeania sp. SIO2D1]|nr:DUF2330 domain-containing protein [Okeania sp. SIO2D1]
EGQVQVGEPKIIERLDAFSAPSLVEYFDPDPCNVMLYSEEAESADAATVEKARSPADGLGVTVESKFTVGEYDIVILSAQESDGLETWLIENGYNIPRGASELLQPYIKQQLKFFVAKVNLEEFAQSGFQSLRPLQMAYESSRFMLPIRLGMINAQGEQDLIVYLLSPQGQVELTNYRTVHIPSNVNLPVFIKEEFADFYRDMFETSHKRENKKVAFLEYAWDMSWCDPCAADPLTPEELKQAGVFWLNPTNPNNVFITRLHVRYSRSTFPEDLHFTTTGNRQNFQGRYILNHPYEGEITCPEGREYRKYVKQRKEGEVQTLAKLTDWDINKIRQKAKLAVPHQDPWWQRIFRRLTGR